MYEFSEFILDNFSGGITDYFIDGPSNRAKELDNLFLEKDGKPRLRPGRNLYDASAPRLPTGNQRVSHLFRHPTPALMGLSGVKLARYTGATWAEILGPSGNPVLSHGAASDRPMVAFWKNHSIIANQGHSEPVKVVCDDAGAYSALGLGLPSPKLQGAIDLANDLRAKFNSHIDDATEHTTLADTVNAVTLAACHDEATLLALTVSLMAKYEAHEGDAELGAAWVYHAAQEAADHSLTNTTTPVTVGEALAVLLDLQTAFNAHDADGTAHGADTLYQSTLSSTPVIANAGAATYLYRFYYEYEYMVGDVLHLDRSATVEVEATNMATGTKAISNLPQLSNGSTRNFDTTAVKLKIARTVASGINFFVLGEVVNGTTVFTDNVSDADLVLKELLYTEGGVLDNDAPPRCKFVVIAGNTGWYFGIVEGQTIVPTRWRCSKRGQPFSVPASFEDDIEDDVVAANAVGDYPIVWTRDAIFRMEGGFDETGRGDAQPVRLPDQRSCVSNLGVVRVPGGLLFPSDEGFCFTDGQRATLISKGLSKRYKAMLSQIADRQNIFGFYNKDDNRVWWLCQSEGGSGDNDMAFVLDFSAPLSEDMPFTTVSGSDAWAVTSMTNYEGTVVMGDKRGFVLAFDENERTDPRIESAVPASQWVRRTIMYNLETCAAYHGTKKRVKGSSNVTIHLQNRGNIGVQVNVQNNLTKIWRPLKPIRHMTEVPWGTVGFEWGSASVPWGVTKPIAQDRNVPPKAFRFDCRQLQVTNAFIVIATSDNLGLGTVNAAAKTLTLNTVGKAFPTDSVEYYLTFEGDSYTAQYLVESMTGSNVLTFADPFAAILANDPAAKWQLHGYQKRDYLDFIDLSYKYAVLNDGRGAFRSGDDGGNS